MRLLTGILAATLTSVVALASANAADMYRPSEGGYKDGPAYATVNWSGFYVGLQGGYGWGNPDYLVPSTGFDHSWSAAGGVVGGMAGYNYQISNIVIGLQGEYNAANITGSQVNTLGHLQSASLDSFGSVDGRVGLAWDRALLYGIGGVAFGNPRQTFTAGGSTSFSGGQDTGWDIGGGVEYRLMAGWTARAEYRHYDFGSVTVQPDGVVLGLPHTQKETADLARVGIAYTFGPSYMPLK